MTEDLFSGCHSLPAGTCLHGAYEIRETIGAGGFAVTYRGVRKDTGDVVAVKEYFPPSLAVRNKQEGLYVLRPFPEKNAGLFQKGLRRFINEAGILKSFQHLESIVSVYDMFEENGTAYIVMEYIDGLTLRRYVTENGTLTFPEISELIVPVVRSLGSVHARGLIHRDISPDNLILGLDNRLNLIDFGAAGSESAGDEQNTVIIKAGYAPPEQYIPNGRTGAWTDIYAICATIYFCITGGALAEAVCRLDDASGQKIPHLGQLLPWQYAILEKGLQLRPAARFQSAGELCAALTGDSDQEENATILAEHDTRGISAGWFRGFRRAGYFGHLDGRNGFMRRVLFAVFGIAATGALIVFFFQTPGVSHMPGTIGTTGGKSPGPGMGEETVAGGIAVTGEAVRDNRSTGGAVAGQQPLVSPPVQTTTGQTDILVMPDVTGKTLKKAKKKIHVLDSSIQIEVSYVYDAAVSKGRVVNQSIANGIHFSRKQIPSVSLTVSKGKSPSATAAAARTPEPTRRPGRAKDFEVRGEDGFASIPLE